MEPPDVGEGGTHCSSSSSSPAAMAREQFSELVSSPEGQEKLLETMLQMGRELAASRLENEGLRASQGMLESELRDAEHQVGQREHARQREESQHRAAALEAAAQHAAFHAEIEQQEDAAQQLRAQAARAAASAAASAAVQRMAMTAELSEQEAAARAQEDRSRQIALAADAERALLGSELGATERSLERSERQRARAAVTATAAAVAAPATLRRDPGRPPPGAVQARHDATGSAARPMGDGLTAADASTGPSEDLHAPVSNAGHGEAPS